MSDVGKLTALAGRARTLAGRGVQNQVAGPWFRIENAAADRATVYLHGVIGDEWDGNDSASFVRSLAAVNAKSIDLRINSGGGLVFDGIAIYSALLEHPAKVTTYVDGIAASAASFIAMAGDEVVVQKPAKMMIHDAAGLTLGNARDMREMADLLDELSDTIAGIYADRSGTKVSDWRAAMLAETWYSAQQAVAAGLADRVANDRAASEDAPDNRRSQLIRARARVTLKG